MFDSVTAAIMAGAPDLAGLDQSKLPDLITDGYVRVAVAKSLLGEDPENPDGLFDDLRSVASAQEAIALLLPAGEMKTSAAYVAASAYRVLAEAFNADDSTEDLLEPQRVSPRLASMLLFLAADSAADAAEVAGDLPNSPNEQFRPLLNLLKSLGIGNIPTAPLEVIESPLAAADPVAVAAAVGYALCHSRLNEMLQHIARPNESDWVFGRFAEIADKMLYRFPTRSPQGEIETQNSIVGPWQLSKLLDMAERVVVPSATTKLASPLGVDEEAWRDVLRRIAGQRPTLWRNHREAIQQGMLRRGVSSVLAFPTGAGKSTVSELKIAATILSGDNAICLVPTLSLIDQLAAAIRKVVPQAKVISQKDPDAEFDLALDDSPNVYVMTPESCLAALGVDADRFGSVGLIFFDEAHLMHSEREAQARRAVDATLCALTLASRFPAADLMLVSAMFANGPRIAEWLQELTGREAISLDSAWKPTRQARGALVYKRAELDHLRERLNDEYQISKTDGAPARAKREMLARPFGFFSLKSTWESNNPSDYRFAPLLRQKVQLGVSGSRDKNRSWWLTPNANVVAAQLASAAADANLKTLVFTQQVTHSVSLARGVVTTSHPPVELNEHELRLVRRSVEILGDESALYLDIEGGSVKSPAIPHHGLLLPDERRLHESLYRRRDGVPVMVATSTVAQGMNFPSEFVLIAGDRRFDLDSNARMQLEAHELLNAAGRAGRAGAHSNALVLVIPGQVVGYDGELSMDSGWFLLQSVFSKSDQCLDLQDPISALVEQADEEERPPLLNYLVRRIGDVADEAAGPGILRRSFSAFQARQAGRDAAIEKGIQRLTLEIATEALEPWLRRCTLITGLPSQDLAFFAANLDIDADPGDIERWMSWLLDMLDQRPELVDVVLRAGSRSALTGAPDELGEWDSSGSKLVQLLREFLPRWLSGATLQEIQALGVQRGLASDSARLEFARKFILRVVPDLAYLFSIPAVILHQKSLLGLTDPLEEIHPLWILGRCVEVGVDSARKLSALELSPRLTRKLVHDLYP
ncbi:DEAD/DEAH box helicase [Salinibacterium hongtaonis]|uniref:DEAD/DEAH box helicase n=1 Tax=Homoserinimonas hongtaonis TaxID=2079791 RepID=A0A2U1T2V7_9MICO|nr:DEAD/DEAH box helicase [Salinibacterium hongtaonis]PWB98221.1 hypothetical protein DF220_10565 [Salinibacterium hongtaonis]